MNMQIERAVVLPSDIFCDTLVIGVFDELLKPEDISKQFEAQLADLIISMIRDQPDCCKFGKSSLIHNAAEIGAKRVLIIGLGKYKKLTLDRVCQISAKAIRVIKEIKSKTVAIASFLSIDIELDDIIQAIIQGAILGSYEFDYYKTDKNNSEIEKLIIVGKNLPNEAKWTKLLEKAKIIANSVNLARDLTNHPSCFMTPSQMALVAQDIAGRTGLEINVLNKEDMEKYKMHALLSVSRGSDIPPKLIVLRYCGNHHSKETVALIGKGVTFDSGGISLKPSEKMGDMKGDMAGAAAVIGAMSAIGQIRPEVNVVAVIPCSENMPSGHAYKPGDVIYSMSGKTIEIISTDAEGRLLLADAITYARKIGATKIVDIATLTGACVVALGNVTSGLITNNDDWSKKVLQAAMQAGEKMWVLPSYDEYLDQIKSDIADLKNSGGRMAGTITAGLFLKQFVDDLPWVHIDIAGTSDTEKTYGYNVKGATGVGVRTLTQLALNIANDAS